MANFNLTTQEIKDTYEQLAQVSASLLVDGTGSLTPILTSSITNFPTEVSRSAAAAGFGSGTTLPSGVISSSAQVIYSGITGVPSGILSSSTQIATDISGAFTSTSASLAANITTKLDTSTFTSYSSSVSTRLTTDEGNISTNTSNISTQTSRVDSLVSATSSYAVKSSNNTFTGTQTFANIAVSGTASIAYLEQVTGSAVVIGEEFIILNTSVPAARYAGIKVYDTGSNLSTASFIFDGATNDWFYEYSGSDETDFGVVLFGPEYDTIGNPLYPTANQIQKGTGGHHLTGSNITDNGTLVSVSTPFTATQITASTGFKGNLDGNATTATTASHALNVGLVSGTGTDSIRSSNNLTTTPANAYGQYSIVLGEAASGDNRTIVLGKNATASGDDGISIGNGATANGARAIAIGEGTIISGANGIALGYQSTANTDSIAIGTGASVSSINSIAIGNQADSQQPGAIAIGLNVETTSSANEINIGNVFKYDGISRIDLSGSISARMSAGQDIIIINTSTATSASRIIIGARENSQYESTGLNSIMIGGGSSTGQLRAAGTNNCVIGGATNHVTESIVGSTNASFATIIGGQINKIMNSGSAQGTAGQCTIIGGTTNTIERKSLAAVSNAGIFGGSSNRVSSVNSTIIGGNSNIISSSLSTDNFATGAQNGYASIIGGRNNKIDSLFDSAIIGGRYGGVSGSGAVVIGGATGSALHDRSVVIGGDSLKTTEANQVVVPNLLVSGQINSPVFSASIASSTSSIDFNEGNFAVLTLTSATHIGNPSNIKSGTTYTLIINSGSLASTYGTSFKFAGGTKPTLSNGVDIVTMVSDGSSLFGTGLANFS